MISIFVSAPNSLIQFSIDFYFSIWYTFSSKKTHPGSVVYLCDCPIDNNKVIIYGWVLPL